MDSSGSVIQTFIDRVRLAVDEPDLDSIYDDNKLIRHVFGPAMTDVFSRVNQLSQNRVVIRHQIDLEDGTQYYQLPPNIKSVIRLGFVNDEGVVTSDFYPLSEFNQYGPGWSIEGNTLSIRPYPSDAQTIYIWYVPSGSVRCHYSTTGGLYTTDTTNKTFSLGTATIGDIDRRPNAYAGQVIRVLYNNIHQERVIESYDVANARVTVRVPFSPTFPTSNITYEIVPIAHEALIEAICMRAAIKVLGNKKGTGTSYQYLVNEYMSSIKSLVDDFGNAQGRSGNHFEKDTIDNPNTLLGTI